METKWTYRIFQHWIDRYSGCNQVHYQIYCDGRPYWIHGAGGSVETIEDFWYHVRNMTPAA